MKWPIHSGSGDGTAVMGVREDCLIEAQVISRKGGKGFFLLIFNFNFSISFLGGVYKGRWHCRT